MGVDNLPFLMRGGKNHRWRKLSFKNPDSLNQVTRQQLNEKNYNLWMLWSQISKHLIKPNKINGLMKDGSNLLKEIRIQQQENNEILKQLLSELVKLNKALPVVKDLIEESEIVSDRQKDLEIKSLMAKQQLLRRRSNGNNKQTEPA